MLFSSINITSQNMPSGEFNLGKIAEALLFYKNVNLLLKEKNLESLLLSVHTESLILLIDNHNLNLLFVSYDLKLITKMKGKYTQIGIGYSGASRSIEEIVSNTLRLKHGNSPQTVFFSKKIIQNIIKFENNNKDITNRILNDYVDKDYLNASIRAVGASMYGTHVPKEIEVIRDEDTSYLFSNANIKPNAMLNNKLGIISGLSFLVEAREQIEMGIELSSEILPNETIAKVIQIRFEKLSKTVNRENEYKLFQDVVLKGLPSISYAINKSPDLISDYIPILEKSSEFKNWTGSLKDDANFLAEYHAKVTNKTIFEKTPIKTMKWVVDLGLSNILGLVNPALGVSYSIGTGIFDAVVQKQWKPDVFINTEVAPFLNNK